MPVTINGTTGITTPALVNGTALAFRNKIINGAMVIDQRNAGASVTIPATTITYTLDRWSGYATQASKFTVQQNAGSVTPPAGFSNYLGVTSSSAYTVGTADQFKIYQPIEGFNFADMAWGTANAQTVTMSFWVRSSLTGTFGGALVNSATSRSYPFAYTISSANTWEQKSITIAGDTSGTWIGATNGVGVYVQFGLGVGSGLSNTAGAWAGANYYSATSAVSVVGTNGATFYITGVQLEAGSVATPFENRPIGTELALCQRYFEVGNIISYIAVSGIVQVSITNSYKTTKRSNPTVTLSSTPGGITTVSPISNINNIYVDAGGSGAYVSALWTASAEL